MFYSEQFGDVTLAKITTKNDLRKLLAPYIDGSEKVIIKPNLVDTQPGVYTSPDSLRLLFEALDQKIIVTEGHQLIRCLKEGDKGPTFMADGHKVDWRWLREKGWGWMIRNPDWSWFRDGQHWDILKEMDRVYLDEMEYSDLFDEYDVEWVNVTDEIWSGNTVDAKQIKETVESKYPPVQHERLYGYLPTRLYENREAPFISYSKLKHYVTFSMKNLFGMIPDPIRAWWHGQDGEYHQQSILDINKLYHAFFNVIGVSEALDHTPVWDKDGKYGGFGFTYNIKHNLGFSGISNDPVQLDSVMYGLGLHNSQDSEHIALAGGILGVYDETLIKKASESAEKWVK